MEKSIFKNDDKNNSSYFDNIKLFLIWGVIFGHLLEQFLGSSPLIKSLYIWIYLFHMPAFVFISGYFYKKNTKRAVKRIVKYILLYFIFQILYSWFFHLDVQFIVPTWPLWYLVSLTSWLAIALWLPINKKVIFGSIILSLVVGAFGFINDAFSLSRTFYFLPFFLMGQYIGQNGFKINWQHFKMIGFLLIVAVLIFIVILNSYFNFDFRILYGKFGYAFFSQILWAGIFSRIFIYFVSLLLMAAIFQLISKTKNIISQFGRETLFIYILHGFFVRINLYNFAIFKNETATLLFAFFYSFLILAALGGLPLLIKKIRLTPEKINNDVSTPP